MIHWDGDVTPDACVIAWERATEAFTVRPVEAADTATISTTQELDAQRKLVDAWILNLATWRQIEADIRHAQRQIDDLAWPRSQSSSSWPSRGRSCRPRQT